MNFYVKIFFVMCMVQVHIIGAQYHFENKDVPLPLAPLVVVGSGPAGYSAAQQAAQFNLPVYLITGDELGGQLVGSLSVDNVPGFEMQPGMAIMEQFEEQTRRKGVHFIHDSVIGVDFDSWPFTLVTVEHGSFHALAVVIATGSTPRTLGIPGEDMYYGKGVYTCAVCDCFMARDKHVAIVGGGDSAIVYAQVLAPYAQSIDIFVRKDHMRASPVAQEKLKSYSHVNVIYSTQIIEICGDGQSMTGLVIEDTQTGNRSYKPDAYQALFLAIGHDPNTALFEEALDLTDDGYILLQGRTQQTTVPGVFAAGDVEDTYFRQAGISAGRGMQAGHEAAEFVRNCGFTNDVVVSEKLLKLDDNDEYK